MQTNKNGWTAPPVDIILEAISNIFTLSLSPILCHKSPVTLLLTTITYHLSSVTWYLIPDTCPLIHVNWCYLSPVIWYLLLDTWYLVMSPDTSPLSLISRYLSFAIYHSSSIIWFALQLSVKYVGPMWNLVITALSQFLSQYPGTDHCYTLDSNRRFVNIHQLQFLHCSNIHSFPFALSYLTIVTSIRHLASVH